MRVVTDAARDGAVGQAEVAQEAVADAAAGLPVAFHHGEKAKLVGLEVIVPRRREGERHTVVRGEDARRHEADDVGGHRSCGQRGREPNLPREFHGLVRSARVAVAAGQGALEERRGLAALDHELAAVPGVLHLEVVVQQHDVRAAGGGEATDLAVHAVSGGRMQRAETPRGGRADAGVDRLAYDPVEAEAKQVVGVAVVGAHAHAFRVRAEFGHGLDRLRQRVPGGLRIAAAEEDPEAVLEKVIRDFPVDRFVGVGDAAGGAGGDEFAAVDVAADGAAAAQRLREDGVAARVAQGDGDVIHFLAQRDGLGPAVENAADLRGREIAARGLERGVGGGYGARYREENGQRRAAGVFEHPLNAGDVAHVADFVRVAEYGGGAVAQGGLGEGARRHHAAFDVHVRIDQAGGDDAAPGVVHRRLARQRAPAEGARGFHRGDAALGDPEFAFGVDAFGVGGEHAGAGDNQFRSRATHGGGG